MVFPQLPTSFIGPKSLWQTLTAILPFFPIQIPTRVIWWRLEVLQRASKQENSGLDASTWEYILNISVTSFP